MSNESREDSYVQGNELTGKYEMLDLFHKVVFVCTRGKS